MFQHQYAQITTQCGHNRGQMAAGVTAAGLTINDLARIGAKTSKRFMVKQPNLAAK
ncbi:MAG: hypothetical protein KME19_11780 [Microcoleus vaginatus WJT46-NPBG5]|nr:hypothetical protein [Microcoleus vaginatus WJT46-NPBG5]